MARKKVYRVKRLYPVSEKRAGSLHHQLRTRPAPPPTPTPPSPAEDTTVVDLAVATADLSTLVTAVKAAGLVDTLSGKGPFTVFAPTNEAFAKLDKRVLDYLLEPAHKEQLTKVLTYHVVAAEAKSTDLKNGEEIKTVEGKTVKVSIDCCLAGLGHLQ